MLTLLFGLRWLRKAILRAAGIIPLVEGGKLAEHWDQIDLTAIAKQLQD